MVTKTVATDGTGDYNCNGNNDQSIINSAIDYVSSLSSSLDIGTVHLKPGTYHILSRIYIKQNVIFEGSEQSTIIFADVGINSSRIGFYSMIQVTGSNTEIRDIDINGNINNVGLGGGLGLLGGIMFWGASDYSNVTFKNINIYNMPDDGIVGAANNTIIDNIHVSNIGHSAIYLGGGSGKTKNYTISNIKTDTFLGNAGIRLFSLSDVYINNIDITSTSNFGIEIATNSNNDICSNVTIKNFRYTVDELHTGINAITIFNSATNPIWHINGIYFENIIINQKRMGAVDPTLINFPTTIYIKNGTNITFENLTLYNAYGDAIRVQNDFYNGQNCNISIKNTILEKRVKYGIYGGDYINWNIIYNDIHNQLLGKCGGTATLGYGNIDTDPLFLNPSNDDFHLQSTSPCIGTGENEANIGANPDLFGEPTCPIPAYNYIITQE